MSKFGFICNLKCPVAAQNVHSSTNIWFPYHLRKRIFTMQITNQLNQLNWNRNYKNLKSTAQKLLLNSMSSTNVKISKSKQISHFKSINHWINFGKNKYCMFQLKCFIYTWTGKSSCGRTYSWSQYQNEDLKLNEGRNNGLLGFKIRD